MKLRIEIALHQRANERGIDAAAQIEPNWHIGAQAEPHGLF